MWTDDTVAVTVTGPSEKPQPELAGSPYSRTVTAVVAPVQT